jgi:hypothetical protein
VSLDLDTLRFETDEGKGDRAREHDSKLALTSAVNGPEFVTNVRLTALATYVEMMFSRLATVATVAALLLTGPSSAASPLANESRVLWQGPALAGEAVLWAEESGGKGSLHLWTARRGDRTVYGSDSLAVTRPFASSRKLLAFERSYPSCPPAAGHVCPEGTDALIGPLRGPYRPLTRPRTCFLPLVGNALAVDGGVAAYLELDCSRQRLRIIVRSVDPAGRPQVVQEAPFSDDCCRDIALAGQYVAWRDGPRVVVYDRLARRVAYRARIGPAGADVDFDFDLQQDGKVAVAFRLIQLGQPGPLSIAWLSRSAPRVHLLPFRGSDTHISIAADRIAFARFVTQKTSFLVVTDLRGWTTTVARLTQPSRLRGFAFDGQRFALASDRITGKRVDCPPPGQGRPCVRRESGVTSLWLRTVSTGRARLITRLTFDDAFGR